LLPFFFFHIGDHRHGCRPVFCFFFLFSFKRIRTCGGESRFSPFLFLSNVGLSPLRSTSSALFLEVCLRSYCFPKGLSLSSFFSCLIARCTTRFPLFFLPLSIGCRLSSHRFPPPPKKQKHKEIFGLPFLFFPVYRRISFLTFLNLFPFLFSSLSGCQELSFTPFHPGVGMEHYLSFFSFPEFPVPPRWRKEVCVSPPLFFFLGKRLDALYLFFFSSFFVWTVDGIVLSPPLFSEWESFSPFSPDPSSLY